MDKNEAIKIIRSNYPTGRNQLCEALETLIPELKESEDKEKPNGGIVLEDFNEGDGFYKVNLAYLSKEQVEEIENIVKKWNPELKESKDEKIKKAISDILLIDSDEIREIFDANNVLMQDIDNWLEKQGEQKPANYSVWVGGSEVNDNYLTKEEAEKLASKYRKDGYEDVAIEKIEQKPAWSEEDEDYYDAIIAKLEVTQFDALLTDNQMEFLKSLKSRMKGE